MLLLFPWVFLKPLLKACALFYLYFTLCCCSDPTSSSKPKLKIWLTLFDICASMLAAVDEFPPPPVCSAATGSCSPSTTAWRRPTTERACHRCRRPQRCCRCRRRAPATPSSSLRPNCCGSTKDGWRPACRSWRTTINNSSPSCTGSGSCWSRYTPAGTTLATQILNICCTLASSLDMMVLTHILTDLKAD